MNGRRRVEIFDTTLRDGEQSPGVSLNVHEKLEIARQLARLGVDVIEAGFPVTSPGDFAAVQAIAREVHGPVIAALARALPGDVERAAEALRPARERGKGQARIHTFIATSPIHMRYKLRKSPEEVIELAVAAVKLARQYVEDVEFSAEDATRSDPEFLARVFGAVIEAGATVLNVPDTVGYTTPAEFSRLIRFLRENVPGIERVKLSVHCHDDLGMAVANSLAGVEAGATQVECTINGLGERAGNAALEEIVMALRTRADFYGVETGIVTPEIYRTSRLVSALTGVMVQPNKAIVGENAFAHEAGIHQDGILKERTTYEIMTPESIGLKQSRLVLGKHSGRHAFRARLAELGYELGEQELQQAYERFIELADRKKNVSDRDLEALVAGAGSRATVPEEYSLEYLSVVSGTAGIATATVKLRRGDEVRTEAACGDGPVDAAYRAIDRITGVHVELDGYQLQAVTGGKDAAGEVVVRLKEDGHIFVGRGLSTDVIEASVRAYLHAFNKLLAARREAQGTAAAGGQGATGSVAGAATGKETGERATGTEARS
ncbi:MAG TPA: 2-isopropylmalate synthase [Firmicutes bacterium]|nr:2-isopropylmalate synthase [Bacillota bacterium]